MPRRPVLGVKDSTWATPVVAGPIPKRGKQELRGKALVYTPREALPVAAATCDLEADRLTRALAGLKAPKRKVVSEDGDAD